MAPKPQKGGSLGQRLTRKAGPLPVYAWALLILGSYLLYRRLHANSNQTGGAQAAPQTTTGGTATDSGFATPAAVGGGTDLSTGTATADLPHYADTQIGDLYGRTTDLQSRLDALTSNAGAADLGYTTSGATGFDGGPAVTAPAAHSPTRVAQATPARAKGKGSFATQAKARSAAAKAAGKAAPFGGVISVRKLKNGSTVTTFASGRKVQQARGKRPYVIHR